MFTAEQLSAFFSNNKQKGVVDNVGDEDDDDKKKTNWSTDAATVYNEFQVIGIWLHLY